MAKRLINKIILHCSDTPTGKDFRESDINEWHRERGFDMSSNGHFTGYHWVICIDGVIEMGRSEDDIGAHCKGNNKDSIGICLIGRGSYTEEQYLSLFYLLDNILFSQKLQPSDVYGHYEFTPLKKCPLIDMNLFREILKKHIEGEDHGTT